MKGLRNYIAGYLASSTNSNIFKNIVNSAISKSLNVVFALFIVRFSLKKIGIEEYGVFLTISTIVAWLSLLDFGLVASLRNKLSFFFLKSDLKSAQLYISGVYLYYSLVLLTGSVAIMIISYLVNWSDIFNISQSLNNDVRTAVQITLIGLVLKIFLSVINSIIHAREKSSHIEILGVLTQFLLLIYLFFDEKTSLVSISVFTAIAQNLLYLIYSLVFFIKNKSLIPIFSVSKLSVIRDIKTSSKLFFIIQVSAVLLYSTDNFLISNLFSPTETSKYNIAFRYFNIITMFWSTVLSPYWAAVSKEYANKNIKWIKKSCNNLMKIWILIVLCVIVLIISSNYIYKIWLGVDYKIPFSLSLTLGIYVTLAAFSSIFSNILNGIGRLKIQSYVIIFVSILNVIVAVLLSKYTNLGFVGVPVATCISQIFIAVVCYTEYKKAIYE